MKRFSKQVLLSVSALSFAGLFAITTAEQKTNDKKEVVCCSNPDVHHVCVMKTILGIEEPSKIELAPVFITSDKVNESVNRALAWMGSAQNADGGWAAGSHGSYGNSDNQDAKSDPASTALSAMALLRMDNTLEKGTYSKNLQKATELLLVTVEQCPQDQEYLTTLENTQPQTKLGRNIDVILTAQFFTNILRYDISNKEIKSRLERALDKCIARIESSQDEDGSWKDGGWAPVLQSALANNALEAAATVGRQVDSSVIERSRKYQNGNFDLETNSAETDKAAGVLLYGLSSTTRTTSSEVIRMRGVVKKARKEGKIKDEKLSEENLLAAGVPKLEAKGLMATYSINQATLQQAISEDVMVGFGNNGGEEFMSFLMTGESMLMEGGEAWKKWYDMMSGKLMTIQNKDGSWNGHHCITSPVFCTATCLLVLSIHKDMQFTMNTHHSN